MTKQGATASCRFSRTGHFLVKRGAEISTKGFCLYLIGFGKSLGGFCVIKGKGNVRKTCRTAKVPNFSPSLPLTKGPKVDFLQTLTGSI